MRGMMDRAGLSDARRVFAADMLGVEEIAASLGFDPLEWLSAEERESVSRLAFDSETLMRGADEGMMLVLRVPRGEAGAPLTVLELADRFPGSGDLGKSYRGSWFAAEPFATNATCRLGWALVDKQPLADSRNRSYGEQATVLDERARRMGLPLRRRTAIEIVYDTLLYAAARRERLLEAEWDWSSSATTDGGLVTAGQFDERGLRLLGYSRGVRFDSLGVCATLEGL